MEIQAWLEAAIPKHHDLTVAVESLVKELLKSKTIKYLTVTGRTKPIDSIREKIERKEYRTPESELTDISGIRVITVLESDVNRISQLIEEVFCIDRTNSLDKSSILAIDQVGYRSVHFVCDLGEERSKLPEYQNFKGLKFEIQVRTALQHAWAELSHSNYKFNGRLPDPIQRKLNLYAGMLEIVDEGFDNLAIQIDEYSRNVDAKTKAGELAIEVNSLSLASYLEDKTAKFTFPIRLTSDDQSRAVDELRTFGIETIAQLDALLAEPYLAAIEKHNWSPTWLSLMRNAMMFTDINRYFDAVWNNRWNCIETKAMQVMGEKYTLNKVREILIANGIAVDDKYF